MFSSPAGSYQYHRLYARMQALTISPNVGPYDKRWAQAIFVMDANNWGSSANDNWEFHQPEENIPGVLNVVTTVGFKAGISVELGKPPLTVGGSADTTYTGTLTTSSEYWHPWVLAEIGSGGVQYCNYTGNGNWNKKVAARIGIRQTKGVAAGYWSLGDAQFSTLTGCPGPG